MAVKRVARTLEDRENEMISLAVDAAEEQLRNGTASAQVIVHYLKLGTQREQLEKEELKRKIELLEAKTEMVKSSKMDEEYYNKIISVIKSYQGVDYEPTTNIQ